MFSNGLVRLIRDKLEQDLNSLLQNQVQFSHTIDELIQFSSQLDTYLGIASADLTSTSSSSSSSSTRLLDIYTTLHIICENNRLFSHWLNLERQLCQKKLDMLFISMNRLQQQQPAGDIPTPTLDPNAGTGVSPSSSSTSQNTQSSSSLIFNNNEKMIEEIWSCKYADVDVMKPSHCAETFVLMIKAITGNSYQN